MKSVTNFYASTLSFAYLPFKNYFLNKTPLTYAFYLSNEEFKTEIKKKKLNQHSFIKNNTPEHDLYFSIKELEG